MKAMTILAVCLAGCAADMETSVQGVEVAGAQSAELLATQCQFSKQVSSWASRFYTKGWDFGCDAPHDVCSGGFCQLRASCHSPQFTGSLEVRQDKRVAGQGDNAALKSYYLKGGSSIGGSNAVCTCSQCYGGPSWPSL
jgi:hypothetical protein